MTTSIGRTLSPCRMYARRPRAAAAAARPPGYESNEADSRQVNESVLRKVIEWCEHHRNDPMPTQDDESDARKKTTEIEEWDQKFMQVDQEMLFEIILVCNAHHTL